MRYSTSVLLALICISSAVFSQKIEVGALVRPALTSIRGNENLSEFTNTVKLSLGVQANYYLTEKSLINASILYDNKGAVANSNIEIRDQFNQLVGISPIEINSDFKYLTIPVQWRNRFGKKVRFEFGAGLYFSYLLQQRIKISGTQGLIPETDEDGTKSYKNFDFGVSLSLGILLPINDSLELRIGIDDNFGLIDVAAKSFFGSSVAHNSMGLSCSIAYRLK
jgi:hypothetical protein